MVDSVRRIMTPNPVMLPPEATIREAAERMRDGGIGDVLIVDDGRLQGIVTDRDIVVRAVAYGMDPDTAHVDQVWSDDFVTCRPEETVAAAERRMRERLVRRVVVVSGGSPVGIITLGDVAIDEDPTSALAEISAADPQT